MNKQKLVEQAMADAEIQLQPRPKNKTVFVLLDLIILSIES
jgi:hypothetical protein